MLRLELLRCYATPISSFPTIATTNGLSLLREPGDTATLKLLLLTSFATIASAIAYVHASVVRPCIMDSDYTDMQLLLQLLWGRCCSNIEFSYNCYYERVIASTRATTNCYAATAIANEFCCSCYSDRLR